MPHGPLSSGSSFRPVALVLVNNMGLLVFHPWFIGYGSKFKDLKKSQIGIFGMSIFSIKLIINYL
jgi:hypothetical protein